MKKAFLLLVVLLAAASFPLQAQSQVKVGFSGGINVPFGDFGEAVGVGSGGAAHLRYFITDEFAAGVNTGYHLFLGEDIDLGILGTIEGIDFSFIPITAGAEYYIPLGELRPRIGFDLGLYLAGTSLDGDGVEAFFGITPNVGAAIKVSDQMDLIGDLKFHNVFPDGGSTISFMGVNVGVMFGF